MGIIDLHCDILPKLLENKCSLFNNTCHFDIERAQQAGLILQIMSLFTMPADSNTSLRNILFQIDNFYQELDSNAAYLYLVTDSQSIKEANHRGKIGCLLHLEGAEALGNDDEILRILYKLGLRSIALTWNARNLLADGVGEGKQAGGLSVKGKELVRMLEGMNILLDLAHLSEKGFYEVLENYNKPVMVSHANAASLCNHQRNLNDAQLLSLAENGGIVGVTQVNSFIKPGNCTIDDLIDHMVFISDLIWVEHVALGSDFDGSDEIILPGIEGYLSLQPLLRKRGFNENEIQLILKENALRVINRVLG